MQIEIIDMKNNKLLCTAKIEFGLDTFIIEDCKGLTYQELEQFLLKRSELLSHYDIDSVIYDKLGLSHRAYEFGRASEAKILYALLNHFSSPEDEIKLFPRKTEYISMIDLDSRYSNIYILKRRKEKDL